MEKQKNKSLEELIDLFQSNKIGFLQFVLEQQELSEMYVSEMERTGQPQTDETAKQWLEVYETTGSDSLNVDDKTFERMLEQLN